MIAKVTVKLTKNGEVVNEIVFDAEVAEAIAAYNLVEDSSKVSDKYKVAAKIGEAVEKGKYKASVKVKPDQINDFKSHLSRILQDSYDFKALMGGIEYVVRTG